VSWPAVSLGAVAEIAAGGGAPQDQEDFGDEGHPFVRAGSVKGLVSGVAITALEHLTPEIASKHKLRLFPADTVLFAKSGMSAAIGLVHRLQWPAYVVNHLAAVVCGDRLDSSFLNHYLRSFSPARLIQDAAYPSIRLSDISELKVPLPPLSEQRRIAAILDQADALRAKRREALAQLDSLTQSIFLEMFGDPVRGNGQYPLSSVESIASEEKYSIVDGPFGSSMKPDDYRESGIPVIRIANITKGGAFNAKNLLYIEKALFEKLKRSSIQPHDVLVSRVGTIGNTCIFPDGIGDALLSTTGVCKITPSKERMLPEFLHQAILQPAFQEQIHKSASTSVQKYFNLSALKAWSIIVPPLLEQKKFVEKLSEVKAQRTLVEQSLECFDSLFTSLQHRAFRGEL
jgi:type I restriction enzyme S subunit